MDTHTRIPIKYRAHQYTDGPLGPRTILCFYPDGEWDGWRRRLETCEKAYPQSEYKWLEMAGSMDISHVIRPDPVYDVTLTNLSDSPDAREELLEAW